MLRSRWLLFYHNCLDNICHFRKFHDKIRLYFTILFPQKKDLLGLRRVKRRGIQRIYSQYVYYKYKCSWSCAGCPPRTVHKPAESYYLFFFQCIIIYNRDCPRRLQPADCSANRLSDTSLKHFFWVNRSVRALFLELLQGFDEPYGAYQGAIGNKSFSIYSKFF